MALPRRLAAVAWALPNASTVVRGSFVWVALAALSCGGGSKSAAPRRAAAGDRELAPVTVTRPTVIAFFVIPPGAVDTMPDLAVEADDWNVSMATLGDSLEASGIDLKIVTEPRVRISTQGTPDTVLALGPFRASGYVFMRPGGKPCVRPGGADPDSVRTTARDFARAGRC